MDSETIYTVVGIVVFVVVTLYLWRNDLGADIAKKEIKKADILNGYRREIFDALSLLEDDKEAKLAKKKELLIKINDELSRNIFFEANEVREIIVDFSEKY